MVYISMIICRMFPFLVLLTSIILMQSCTDSIDRSPFVPEFIGTDIQDTTLSGGGLQILGGTIKNTSVSIGFWFDKDNSEDHKVWIERGKDSSTYDFKEILNKYPNDFVGGQKNVYHFENLKTKTTYYILFTREIGADVLKLGTKVTTL